MPPGHFLCSAPAEDRFRRGGWSCRARHEDFIAVYRVFCATRRQRDLAERNAARNREQ